MTGLAVLLCALSAPSIDVSLAPDQPVPFIYVDDPLILQLRSDTDVTITGHVDFTGDDGKTSTVELPETALRAGGKHWQQLEGAPAVKGRYQTHVVLDAGGDPIEARLMFCRIDRPDKSDDAPVAVHMAAADAHTLQALLGIPIRRIEVDAALPETQEVVQKAVKAGYQVALYGNLARPRPDDEALETLSKALGERVAGWALKGNGDLASFVSAVASIRKGGSRAPLAAVVGRPEDLTKYLANGAGGSVTAAILREEKPGGGAVTELRRVAEEAGYEGFDIYVADSPTDPPGASSGAATVRQVMLDWAAGAQRCILDPKTIYDGERFGPAFVKLSALIKGLGGAAYVGDLGLDQPAHALVFRNGAAWTVAAWTTGAPGSVSIRAGKAGEVTCTDACGNARPDAEIVDGAMKLELSPEPLYIKGTGGDVLSQAAKNAAVTEAKRFTSDQAFQDGLPPELVDLVKTVATSKTGRTERLNFFGLLRMFPLIEQQWHEGHIRMDVAVPAMASMARVVRSLCILEQEANEPFIELLQETLARCGEYQSQYLTSTGGADVSHERADWLSGEVSRLMAEAKSLSEQGRGIEAVGVASLAEWRARALGFAAQAAPLGQPAAEPETTTEKPRDKSPRPGRKGK